MPAPAWAPAPAPTPTLAAASAPAVPAEPAPEQTSFVHAVAPPAQEVVDPLPDVPSWQPPARRAAPASVDDEPQVFSFAAEPSVPPTPAPAPAPASPPGPTIEQARAVAEIARLLQAGDSERAITLAAALDAAVEAGTDHRAVPAAREVHAYVALMTDRPGLAVELYADAAPAWLDLPEETARMARNAHFSWLRVVEPESAYDLGSTVLRAYETVPDAPGREAVRDRMRALRSRLSDG
ncbi:hypothetical protein [Embleya sp. NPDC020630]|uniref:hypothetical protein n=1 Tax=Embleya sp. NPDC020630 TaxID=3363979 RepID=UPI003788ADC3